MIYNELKIAYIHLPKTGGRSFQEYLSNKFKRKFLLNNDRFSENKEIIDWCHYNFVGGHFPYKSQNLPRIFQYITILRDPVQRTISQYNHLMHSDTSLMLAKVMRDENWSFMDFVSNHEMRVAAWVNSYTVYLSTYDEQEEDFNTVTKVKQACYNLAFNFAFVGITERMDETVKLFNKKFGCNAEIGVIGKTPESKKAKISEDDMRELRIHLSPDITVYEVANEIFDDALKKEGIT